MLRLSSKFICRCGQSSFWSPSRPFLRVLGGTSASQFTNPLSRVADVVRTASKAFVNPERGDLVALLGDLTADVAIRKMRDQMRDDPDGRKLLATRPRIRNSDVAGWNLD